LLDVDAVVVEPLVGLEVVVDVEPFEDEPVEVVVEPSMRSNSSRSR
jgi:hypothetical protein